MYSSCNLQTTADNHGVRHWIYILLSNRTEIWWKDQSTCLCSQVPSVSLSKDRTRGAWCSFHLPQGALSRGITSRVLPADDPPPNWLCQLRKWCLFILQGVYGRFREVEFCLQRRQSPIPESPWRFALDIWCHHRMRVHCSEYLILASEDVGNHRAVFALSYSLVSEWWVLQTHWWDYSQSLWESD